MASHPPSSTARHLFTALCISLLLTLVGNAQQQNLLDHAPATGSLTGRATLGGTVVDENDDVIPDADVLVEGVNTVLQRRLTTSGDGSFMVPHLPPDNYTIDVQHQGFASTKVKDIALKVNDQLRLKIQLKVGRLGETVTIEGESVILRKPLSTGASLSQQSVENLPLNGRSVQPLEALTPGVVPTKSTTGEQGQFSVNGQRADANYLMVDGVSANIGVAAGAEGLGQSGGGSLPGLSALGSTNTLFSIDGLQQFKIQTSTYAPEFGRTPGAQVSVTTRAGTDKFHGTLFEYFRGGVMEARDWFANRDQLPSPSSLQNDFGGVLGGPLIKGRTYFFISYEGLRLRVPEVRTVDVPSVAARLAAPVQLKPFLNAFPAPNGAEAANGLAPFSASYRDPATLNAASIRIDQRFGDNLTVFGRYNYAPSQTIQRGVASSLNTLLFLAFRTQTLTLGATDVITTGIVNDLRANYSRTTADKSYELDNFGGAATLDETLVFPSYASLQDSLYSFSLGGDASFIDGRNSKNFQQQINLVDNLAVTAGDHQLKFGLDYRRLSPLYDQRKYEQDASFNGVAGALTGRAASVSVATQDRTFIYFTNFSAYAQDTWDVTRRLLLTYGLRWEINPPPSNDKSQDTVRVQGLDNAATLSLAPQGTPLYRTTYHNFAPRIGVAFLLSQRPGRETVLRGGFGLFYDLGIGPLANAASSFPYSRAGILSNVPYPLSQGLADPPAYSLFPLTGPIYASDPNLKLPVTYQWNATLEQSLGSNQTVSASYVGALGRRLLRTEMLFRPNPDFSQVFVTTNQATSDYHSLQILFQRRLSRGLQALVSYTWSHSIDTASNDSVPNPPGIIIDPSLDRGPSDFDVRHTLSTAVTYNIPSLHFGSVGNALVRHWSFDAIVTYRTATPINVFLNRDLGFGPFDFRPDLVAGVPLYLDDPLAAGGRIINRAAFAIPNAARQGTLGRNVLRGFPFSQTDLALRRRLALTERFNLLLSAEFFNIFNHPNFADPIGDLSSSLFGRSTSLLGRSLAVVGSSAGLNPAYQVGGPRAIQLGLKLQF